MAHVIIRLANIVEKKNCDLPRVYVCVFIFVPSSNLKYSSCGPVCVAKKKISFSLMLCAKMLECVTKVRGKKKEVIFFKEKKKRKKL